jgi:hypothetical protein
MSHDVLEVSEGRVSGEGRGEGERVGGGVGSAATCVHGEGVLLVGESDGGLDGRLGKKRVKSGIVELSCESV